jgi:cell division protein FtsB
MNFLNWEDKTFRRNAVFVLALLSLIFFMHEIFGRNGYMTLRQQKKEYTHLQQQIQSLSQQNEQMEQKINALKNNPEAVEKQARDQLHLAKPGEIIYMLPGKDSAQPSSPRHSKPAR